MKRGIAVYLGVSLLLYFLGLSPFARNYIKESFGLRNDTFDPTDTFWIDGTIVYAAGIINSRSADHLPKSSEAAFAKIDLKAPTDEATFSLSVTPPPDSARELAVERVSYGSEAGATAASHPDSIYAVLAERSATRFIVDSHSDPPRLFSVYHSSEYYRTPSARSVMWLAVPVAHLVDVVTAPFQLVAIAFIYFTTPKWN